MLNSLRPPVALAAIAATMFFINLGATHLWDVDEAIFAETAREMYQRGDAAVPYFNGELFTHKPPMMFWLMMAGFEMFGTTELAARFWSAAFGVGSVLLTYRLGRLMFSPSVAFWSGLILATSLNFNVIARAATPDSFLVFFSTWALLVFVAGTAKAQARSGAPNERNAPWAGQTRFEPSWRTYALAYAVMGLGVLTKGPIGVVLPTATIGLFLLVMRVPPSAAAPAAVPESRGARWLAGLRGAAVWGACVFSPRDVLRTIWSMRPLTALAVVLAVAGPWYAWVGYRTDGEWLVGFFGVHNFGRFLNSMDNHRGPIFYYLVAIAVGLFPWSVLIGPTLGQVRRHLGERHPWRAGYVLVSCWIAVWVGFFSLAGTKLPSYVVPAYPALALAVAAFVSCWSREPALVPRTWTPLVWGTVALVGVAVAVALPIVAHLLLGGEWLLGALGLIPLAAAAVGWTFCRRGQVRHAAATLAALGGVLWIAVFGFAAVYVDGYQESPAFAARIASLDPSSTAALGSFRHFRPSYVFYTDRTVAEIDSPEGVAAFFDAHGGAFVITNDRQYEKLRGHLPDDVTVLEDRLRLLQPGRVLLLGRRVQATARAAESLR